MLVMTTSVNNHPTIVSVSIVGGEKTIYVEESLKLLRMTAPFVFDEVAGFMVCSDGGQVIFFSLRINFFSF